MPTLASTTAPESFPVPIPLDSDIARRGLNTGITVETEESFEGSFISNFKFSIGSQTDRPLDSDIARRGLNWGTTVETVRGVVTTRLVDNSTALQSIPEIIDQEASSLEIAAKDSFASDEDDTQFRYQMESFVRRYGGDAVKSLAVLINLSRSDPVTASRMLEAIGAIDHQLTITARSVLLQQGLHSKHAVMRYGSALGLASLRDRRSLASLEEAVKCEPNEELRNVFLQVCAFLKTPISDVAV